MTQPDVYIGFTPSLGAGHGNHQMAGRYIWEGVKAAADPSMFPEQLTGPNALSTWQVKKVFSGGSTAGTGGTTGAADCTTGFLPRGDQHGRGRGRVDRLRLAVPVAGRQRPGPSRGHARRSGRRSHSEGQAAYPTQSRVMNKSTQTPGCSRFGMTDSYVPFQPNANADGTANARRGQGRRDPLRRDQAGPGRAPARHARVPVLHPLLQHAGHAVHRDAEPQGGRRGAAGAGTVALTLPAGWTADAASKPVAAIADGTSNTVQFTITPPADAAVDTMYKIAARYTSGADERLHG